MQVKRSRVACSSSCVETGFVDALDRSDPTELGWNRRKAPRISQDGDRPRPGILRVASPEIVKEVSHYVHNHGWNFLERCHFCKKMMDGSKEVYMYGILRAFCTPQCREKQFLIDNIMERVAEKSKGTGADSSRVNGAKNK